MKIKMEKQGVKLCVEAPNGVREIITQVGKDLKAAEFTTNVFSPTHKGRTGPDSGGDYYHERVIRGEHLTRKMIESVADNKPYNIEVNDVKRVDGFMEATALIFINEEVLI